MEQADALVEIPMLGAIDSMNVSVAASILIYEGLRQRGFS
jgi:23S rRNA (guanosine2251-2'-O)-methyltransferase